MAESTALAPALPADVLLPAPVVTGDQMVQAYLQYRDLLAKLIRAMPDQLVRIGDKEYPKRPIYRSLGRAFRLSIEFVSETEHADGAFDDGRDNFGWLVIYRATTPDGCTVTGDGACHAIEKAEKFRCPHPEPDRPYRSIHFPHDTCPDYDPAYRWRYLSPQATVHNVRSHAHTRAFNRAISNLVGFGEVSGEEMTEPPDPDDPDDVRPGPAMRPVPRPGPQRANGGRDTRIISDPQVRRLQAIASSAGWTEHERHALLARYGFESAKDVTRDKYEAICTALEGGTGGLP